MNKEELEKEVEEWLDERYLKDMGVRKPCKEAYLAAAEPREMRIAELESKIKHITEHLSFQSMSALFKQVEEEVAQEQRLKVLEKENAELKSECRRCVYTDSPCVLSDYGKDRNGICDHFKDVFDENAELKTKWLQATDEGTSWAHRKILEQENAELKARLNAINLLTPELEKQSKAKKQQLTKAKELLREIIDTPVFNQVGGELYENEGYTELVAEAEQFLKEEN